MSFLPDQSFKNGGKITKKSAGIAEKSRLEREKRSETRKAVNLASIMQRQWRGRIGARRFFNHSRKEFDERIGDVQKVAAVLKSRGVTVFVPPISTVLQLVHMISLLPASGNAAPSSGDFTRCLKLCKWVLLPSLLEAEESKSVRSELCSINGGFRLDRICDSVRIAAESSVSAFNIYRQNKLSMNEDTKVLLDTLGELVKLQFTSREETKNVLYQNFLVRLLNIYLRDLRQITDMDTFENKKALFLDPREGDQGLFGDAILSCWLNWFGSQLSHGDLQFFLRNFRSSVNNLYFISIVDSSYYHAEPFY